MLTILISAIKLLLGLAGKFSDASIARQEIAGRVNMEALRAQVQVASQQRDIIVSAHGYRVFWVAWALAAVPMAAWFGWGMLDTLTNGWLPDVATIPTGLKPYADTVWENIFFTGAIGAVAQGAAGVIAKALTRR
jgi:hypothetical protein